MESTPSRLNFQVGQISLQLEGSQELVREGLSFIRDYLPLDVMKQAAESPLQQEVPLDPEPTLGGSSDADPDLRAFYQSHAPRSDMEKVTVLAYYSERYLGENEVSEASLRPLFNEAGERKLPNQIPTAMNNAARSQYGYLQRVAGKRGVYRITNAGRNLVNVDLANRASNNS